MPDVRTASVTGLPLGVGRAVARSMSQAGVINGASPYCRVTSAYVMAGLGVLGPGRAPALEGAEPGITANAICPGCVPMPLVEQQITGTALPDGGGRTAH